MATAGTRKFITVLLAGLMAASPLDSAATELVKIPQGTAIKLTLLDPISTRTAQQGERVQLEVSENVYVGTKLVIPAGQPTFATVAEIRQPGGFGRSGRISLEFGSVEALDGTVADLAAWSQDRAETMGYAAGAAVGGAAILGPIGLVGGLFVRGRHMEVPEGHTVMAAIRWDTVVEVESGPLFTIRPPEIEDVEPFIPDVPVIEDVAQQEPEPAPVVEPVETEIVTPVPVPVGPEPEEETAPEPEEEDIPQPVGPVIPIIEDITDY